MAPQRLLHNGQITTLFPGNPNVSAIAITDGMVSAVGSDDDILALADAQTEKIDLSSRCVIPGLNDSHLHVIRAGLFYNLELRWDGVASVSQALKQLKEQADNTPPPQWVRVIGGWNEFQFAEGRMPTLDEINKAAPDTPVFLLHLYDSALLNRAALRVLGFNKDTPNPPGGLIARDAKGNPTGLLIAEPSALILYSTIANAPKLSFEDQLNSTRHYLRELNRFGVTRVSDAGGGGQNYPEDYAVVKKLDDEGHLTVRIAYSLFAQKPGEELNDYTYGSAWFSHEDDKKGTLEPGRFADLAVLSADYFAVEDDAIRGLESVLTMVGGRVVHGTGEYARLAPSLSPVSPDWSPVARFGGYDNTQAAPPIHDHTPVMAG